MWNQIGDLYNTASTSVAAMRDTLPKRFQSAHETAFLLYKVMIRNIENGQKGPKGNIEKEKK